MFPDPQDIAFCAGCSFLSQLIGHCEDVCLLGVEPFCAIPMCFLPLMDREIALSGRSLDLYHVWELLCPGGFSKATRLSFRVWKRYLRTCFCLLHELFAFALVNWSLGCFCSAGLLAANVSGHAVYTSRRAILATKCNPREGVQSLEGDLHNWNKIHQQDFLHNQLFTSILAQETIGSAVKTPSYSSSSVLGLNALKTVEGAVKRKESAHSSGQPKEKKKKSALDEIMEVMIVQDLAL